MPKESVEVVLSTWDYVLRVWAVAGPLLAGAVSAIWSRRNQVQDRNYQNKLQSKKEEKQAEENKRIRSEDARLMKHAELKDACIEFMASSHEYVRKQSEFCTHPSSALQDHAREANDRFVLSNQKVILLGNEELLTASITFWNATIAIPKSYSVPADEEYNTKLRTYQTARSGFNLAAKSQLGALGNAI